jgi:putative transposase
MRENKLRAKRQYRKPRYVAGRTAVVAPNHLEQDFRSPAPDRIWVTDITYIRTLAGWLFLAAVLDLCTRRVVGWSMSGVQDRGLVLDAFSMAVKSRRPKPGLVLHSDQGVQFGAEDVQRFLQKNGIIQSMSRRGNCYDNAAMESFFSTLKKELIQGKIYSSHSEAKLEIVDYVEGFYNRERIHSSLGGVSPAAFEALYFGT